MPKLTQYRPDVDGYQAIVFGNQDVHVTPRQWRGIILAKSLVMVTPGVLAGAPRAGLVPDPTGGFAAGKGTYRRNDRTLLNSAAHTRGVEVDRVDIQNWESGTEQARRVLVRNKP